MRTSKNLKSRTNHWFGCRFCTRLGHYRRPNQHNRRRNIYGPPRPYGAALSAAGLPSDRFIFEGFLPAKAAARQARLQGVAEESRTLIFYEAPHRLLESLQDMCEAFGGQRQAVLGRELSKTFETLKGLPLDELCAWVAGDGNQQRGECVVLVAGWQAPEGEDALSGEALRVLDLLLADLPLKRAAALAAEITGVRKNLLYQVALERQ